MTKVKCNCGVSMGVRTDHEAECAAAYNTKPQPRSFLPCGHDAIFERSDAGRKHCLKCFGVTDAAKSSRARWHDMLDRAMDQTREGENFVAKFVEFVVADLRSSQPQRSCSEHSDCDKAMDEEMKRGGTFLHHAS